MRPDSLTLQARLRGFTAFVAMESEWALAWGSLVTSYDSRWYWSLGDPVPPCETDPDQGFILFHQCKSHQGFPGGSEVKASACNAGDLGSIPRSGRSPGGGNGNPLQYSCLENPRDGGAWWAIVHGVVKSRTQLIDFTSPMQRGT